MTSPARPRLGAPAPDTAAVDAVGSTLAPDSKVRTALEVAADGADAMDEIGKLTGDVDVHPLTSWCTR